MLVFWRVLGPPTWEGRPAKWSKVEDFLPANLQHERIHAVAIIFGKQTQQLTVDGRNPANQLRLVVYPIIYMVSGRVSTWMSMEVSNYSW